MEFELTLKIKDEHKPPTFDKNGELGNGELVKITVKYDITEEEFNSPLFQSSIISRKQKLMEEYMEVVIKKL